MKSKETAANRVLGAAMAAVLAVSLVPLPALADAGLAAGGIDGDGADVVAVSADDLHYTAGSYASGEVLVEYDNAGASGLVRGMGFGMTSAALAREAGLDVVKTVLAADEDSGTLVKAEAPEGMSIEEAVAAARSVPGVASAQPNFRYELFDGWDDAATEQFQEAMDYYASADGTSTKPSEVVNDKYITRQYYLGSWEDTHGVGAGDAWELAQCNNEVTVAVIDTGCAVEHADLADNIVTDFMWDAYNDTKKGTIISNRVPYGDNSGHGTHVCGIAGATADNGIGIAGASFNANILPIKVFDNLSSNPGADTETIVKAYEYIKDLKNDTSLTGEARDAIDGLHVINMSLGGYGDADSDDDELLKDDITELREKYEVLTVVAGGNGNRDGTPRTDQSFPSDYKDSFAVTATNSDGANVVWSDYNEYKDISAPGYDIYATFPGDPEIAGQEISMYTTLNGTSMASPLVAGCAALIWAAYPGATPDEVVKVIQDTANEIDPNTENYWVRVGNTGSPGVIDVAAAVEKILENGNGVRRIRMKSCTVGEVADQVYTGRALEPQLDVTYHDEETGKTVPLEFGRDYTLDYRNNRNVGTASVSVVGRGGYVGRSSTDFKIKYDMKVTNLALDESYDFTGEPCLAKPIVTRAGHLLSEGVDYELSWRDNDEPGTGVVVAQGVGDSYMNKTEATFSIIDRRPQLSAASVGSIAAQTYTGKALSPKPSSVTYNGAKLTLGKDYELSYLDNVDPGLAVVRVKGIGNYGGQKLAVFRIVASKNLSAASVGVASATYTGKALKPKVTVKNGAATIPASAYTVTYKNNVNVGLGTVTVTPKAKGYSGKKTATFAINPKATAPKKLAGASKAVTLTWTKQAKQVTGYEVMTATNSKFTANAKTAKAKASAASLQVKGLKAKTTYYAKIRTYTTVKGKTYYSAWSKVLSAKTK